MAPAAAAAAPRRATAQVLGVALALVTGSLGAGEIVASKVLVREGWPFYYLGAINMVVFASVCAVARPARDTRLPHRWELKWIVARGCFGCLTGLFATLSVQVGAEPGDASALLSINVVVAALLGHAILGERLRPAHFFALACSVTGGMLIARPKFLFGEVDHPSANADVNPALGNCLAVVAGLCLASVFITARMAPEAPGLFCSGVCSAIGAGLYCIVPTLIGRGDSMARVKAEPWSAFGVSVVLLAISGSRIMTGVAGAQLAPAAVSATCVTVSAAVMGYVLQFLLFQEPPEPTSVVGAALMVAAVIVMAGVRVKAADRAADAEARTLQAGSDLDAVSSAGASVGGATDASSRAGEDEADDRDEVESIGSFVAFAASEFAEVGGHRKPIRNRRPTAAPAPAGTVVGMAAAMSV